MIVFELTHVFQFDTDGVICAPKALGFYSSLDSARAAIDSYKAKPGFKDFPDGFVVRQRPVVGTFTDIIFEALVYFHSVDFEEEFSVELGLFAQLQDAENAVASFRKDNEDLFHQNTLCTEAIVNTCRIDARQWDEGFVYESR